VSNLKVLKLIIKFFLNYIVGKITGYQVCYL